MYIQASDKFGILIFLIQSIKSGDEVRLSKLLKLMRARDVRATGGLDKPEFVALVNQHLPYVQQYEPSSIISRRFASMSNNAFVCRENAKAWFDFCAQNSADALPYDTLLPVLMLFEAEFVLEKSVEKGKLQTFPSYVIHVP